MMVIFRWTKEIPKEPKTSYPSRMSKGKHFLRPDYLKVLLKRVKTQNSLKIVVLYLCFFRSLLFKTFSQCLYRSSEGRLGRVLISKLITYKVFRFTGWYGVKSCPSLLLSMTGVNSGYYLTSRGHTPSLITFYVGFCVLIYLSIKLKEPPIERRRKKEKEGRFIFYVKIF